MPKDLTKRCSINWDYPRTEHNIRHRQKRTENKLDKICQQLRIHLQQQYSCYYSLLSDKTSIDEIMYIISDTLQVLIQNGLKELHTRFEQKKSMLPFDADEIQLMKSFYELHLTEDQKIKAEKIWRGKRKYCQRQIHQKKFNSFNNKRSNTTITFKSKANQSDLDQNNHQFYQMPFSHEFDPLMCAIIEARCTINNTNAQRNVRRYNIDDIHTTPSPLDNRPYFFQAGSIIDPVTFARIEASVTNHTVSLSKQVTNKT
ncbi:unnamed protein product [Adineta ricciae]|uniref:Uncharacterized protein n=1 Tax=Adineta ricciae TaxID=249248 RepID=A0A816DRN0_ADIRI|nr:unnamed protein product [Adineta ricciae]CAF1640574.1 unnamed protein product [Adineta ricciae]